MTFLSPQDVLEQYASKWLVFSLIWSFAGDGKFKIRNELGDFIRSSTTITLPPANTDIIDYEVRAPLPSNTDTVDYMLLDIPTR